jgi:hypothetical protein
MANGLYNAARVKMVAAQFDWAGFLVVFFAYRATSTYVFDPTHGISDIGAPDAVSEAVLHQTITPTGYCRSDPVQFNNVAAGADIKFLVIAEKGVGGAAGAWSPVCYFDQGIDLPFVPNGNDIIVRPDWLADRGWFRP